MSPLTDLLNRTQPGQFTFYGELDPANGGIRHQTFTLGIFRVTVGARGQHKRNKVIYRVKGNSHNPQPARDLAQKIVDEINALGWTSDEAVKHAAKAIAAEYRHELATTNK